MIPTFGSLTATQPRYVHGRCGVARASMPALKTAELVSCRTIPLVNQTATRARPARVAWVDRDNRNTNDLGLVFDKATKLGKSPTVVRAALRPSNRDPIAYTRQVLNGNTAIGVFGLPHNSLTDPVVQILGKTSFLHSALVEQPLGRLRSLPLKVPPQPSVPVPEIGVVRPAEGVSVAVGCYVLVPEIDTKIVVRVTGRHVSDIDRHVEEEHAVPVDQVSLSAHPVEPSMLICTNNPRHDLASGQRPDGNPVTALPRQDTLVIDDGAVRVEGRLDRLVSFVDFHDLRDSPDGHLCRQSEVLADTVVSYLLQLELAGALVVKGYLRQCVACRVEPFHRRQERRRLGRCRQEFRLHRQLHGVIYKERSMSCQEPSAVGGTAIPPGRERPGFSRMIW